METPTYDGLRQRIEAHMSHRPLTSLEAAAWSGYIAALLEWGLISVEDHRKLGAILPRLSPEPSLPIFLGPANWR
jgi:hypothetical protein